jgi:hypothetical protein
VEVEQEGEEVRGEDEVAEEEVAEVVVAVDLSEVADNRFTWISEYVGQRSGCPVRCT